jgi:hypothetical protein
MKHQLAALPGNSCKTNVSHANTQEDFLKQGCVAMIYNEDVQQLQ